MAIRKGSVQVQVYRCPRKTGYTDCCMVYDQDGVRKRANFSDFERAMKEAESVADRLGSKDADVLVLKSADRAA